MPDMRFRRGLAESGTAALERRLDASGPSPQAIQAFYENLKF
jgi:hypothetical protein